MRPYSLHRTPSRSSKWRAVLLLLGEPTHLQGCVAILVGEIHEEGWGSLPQGLLARAVFEQNSLGLGVPKIA